MMLKEQSLDQWFAEHGALKVTYDREAEQVRIKDNFGFWYPISLAKWYRFVEVPYRTMKQYGKTKERVIRIYLGDFSYLYVGLN